MDKTVPTGVLYKLKDEFFMSFFIFSTLTYLHPNNCTIYSMFLLILRKLVGVLLILVGVISGFIPLIPGFVLVLLGLHLLGIPFLSWSALKERVRAWWSPRRDKQEDKITDTDPSARISK